MSEMFSLDRHTIRIICDEYDKKATSLIEKGEVPVVDMGQKYVGTDGRRNTMRLTDEVKRNLLELHTICVREGSLSSGAKFLLRYNDHYGANMSNSTMIKYSKAVGLDVFKRGAVGVSGAAKKRKRQTADTVNNVDEEGNDAAALI